MTALTRPGLTLELGGQPLQAGLQANLSSMTVLQRGSLPAVCEITLLCPAQAGPLPVAEPGTALTLRVGNWELFSGDVTAVTLVCPAGGVRELRLRAYDPLHRLRKRSPLRVRGEVRLSELAAELAAALGLTLRIEDGLPDPRWTGQLQAGGSDFQVLSGLADRVGVGFSVQGGTLALYGLNGFGGPLTLELGRALLEARVERNTDLLRDSVRVSAWNPGVPKRSPDRLGRRILALAFVCPARSARPSANWSAWNWRTRNRPVPWPRPSLAAPPPPHARCTGWPRVTCACVPVCGCRSAGWATAGTATSC